MNIKQIILNLIKITFAISLFVSLIGCASETTVTLAGDILSPAGPEDDSVDGGNQGGSNNGNDSDNQFSPLAAMIFFIENRDNETDDVIVDDIDDVDPNTLKIRRASGVTTAEVGETTYLFVTGSYDSGFSMFRIADDGTLSNATNVSDDGDDGDLQLDGADGVTTAKVGETNYLFVAGADDNGLSIFRIADDGTVMNTTNLIYDGALELLGAHRVATAEVADKTYLFVAGFFADSFRVFRIANNGTLMNTVDVKNSSDSKIAGTDGFTTTKIGGTTYLFVTERHNNRLSVFRIARDGKLDNVANVSDDDDLEIDGAKGVTTAEVDGKHYLFVTGAGDHGFSMFRIADDGKLDNVTNVSDDGPGGDLNLVVASGVTAAEVDGNHYLFVTGEEDNGFSVFRIADDGTLSNATNVSDGGDLELDGAKGVTTAEVDGKHYLFVTGYKDHGVSVFEFGLRPVSSP